jgi:hypothetical protein
MSARRNALAIVPLALGLAHQALLPTGSRTTAAVSGKAKARTSAAREFSIPLSNLKEWARTVVVSMDRVKIDDHSDVHPQNSDCEMHLGSHTPDFAGTPDGLVLEPMNACREPLPGNKVHKDSDWTDFGDKLKGTKVSVSGVARIWPEHLNGGKPSDPDHAVELHPLTSLTESDGTSLDFSPIVFPGSFSGGLSEQTAQKLIGRVSVTVTLNGKSVDIGFRAGASIGNFTTLEVTIDPATIAGDGAGSFRMDGEVEDDQGNAVAVSIVTVSGSPINDQISQIKAKNKKPFPMDALVLLSLNPQSLLDAASKSNGAEVEVEKPIQLILYGQAGEE